MFDISRWDSDDDPVTRDQVAVLARLLNGVIDDKGLEGFLILSGRFVDNFGGHRTEQLAEAFRTDTPAGREALRFSLAYVCDWNGGLTGFAQQYPVVANPPRPAFPLLRMLGIDKLVTSLYRALDSKATLPATGEPVSAFVARTGRLPPVPVQRRPARRTKPRLHWCSYEAFRDPKETQFRLQIRPQWSDCRIRAVLSTRRLGAHAYLAFNGDRHDPDNPKLRFYNYFYEPLAEDHPELAGGGIQIGLDGSPIVEALEEWDGAGARWMCTWRRSSKAATA